MNSSMPRVTVCLPVRNGALTICRTLDSILAQDNSSLEIIVSDNCSPGSETEDEVKEFVLKDRRIQYYRQAENKGPHFNFRVSFSF